jgi:hypothetical protein
MINGIDANEIYNICSENASIFSLLQYLYMHLNFHVFNITAHSTSDHSHKPNEPHEERIPLARSRAIANNSVSDGTICSSCLNVNLFYYTIYPQD